jgi:hypothetical protein
MTIKYRPTDDGLVVDGKTVVYLKLPLVIAADAASGPAPKAAGASALPPLRGAVAVPSKEKAALAQAAVLVEAARRGVPFCQECEEARRKLAGESTR